MGSKKTKILCFLYLDSGRDVEIILPTLYVAKKFLDCEIEFAHVIEGHEIYKKKPDIVFLPANTIGSNILFKISKYCYENRINVFSIISEGNFRTDGSFDYWGHNTDKKFYQDYVCFWSKRTKDYLTAQCPEFKNKYVLTGAPGFDRYFIYQFETKEAFLKRKNLQKFSKIIGYAGWAFGKMYHETGRKDLQHIHKNTPEGFAWFEKQMLDVENMLRYAIEHNPETLFVLKQHPTEKNPALPHLETNEMYNLRDYDNVLYIQNNENIHDLISVCDLWLGFETTTTLEAWLMKDMQTLLLNTDPHFHRDDLYRGSAIVQSGEELDNKIKELYSTGKIEDFNTSEKIKERTLAKENIIEYADGFNHLRTAFYLKESIKKSEEKKSKPIKISANFFFKYYATWFVSLFYNKSLFSKLPKFKKTIWIFENHKLKKLNSLFDNYSQQLDKYYQKNGLNSMEDIESFWDKYLNKEKK